MKSFTTKKGTELPLRQIQGKDYLQVQERLIWFLEENQSYSISTEYKLLTAEVAVSTARIQILSDGKIVRESTGTKSETPQGFSDYIEKAETGSIGRALANLGYGTQFAHLDYAEGERIVDAPRETEKQNNAPLKRTSRKSEPSTYATSDRFIANSPFSPSGGILWKGKKYKDVPMVELAKHVATLRGKPQLNSYEEKFLSDYAALRMEEAGDNEPPPGRFPDEEIPF